MLPDDARVVSVDDHIIEHPNVWQDRLPAKFKELGPKVFYEDGVPIWTYEGRRYAPLGLDAVAGDDPTEFKLTSKAFEAMRPACYDPAARLRDMRGGKLNDSHFGSRMRGRGAYADGIARSFELFRDKLGLNAPWEALDCTQFRPPELTPSQLRLF